MYTRHKIASSAIFVFTAIAAFFSHANYQEFAVAALIVTSIALVAYIVAISALLGNRYADALKSQPDTNVKGKTQLGVFVAYLRTAGTLGVMCIAASNIYQFMYLPIDDMRIKQVLSSLAYGLFAVNILFLWLIFRFLTTALINSAKRELYSNK